MTSNLDFRKKTLKELNLNFNKYSDKILTIEGWVRNIRGNKNLIFIKLRDGSTLNDVQIICKSGDLNNFVEISKLTISTAIEITGKLILTPKNAQAFEIIALNINILAIADPNYPLQKKEHSLEYLREIAHIRSNTKLFQSVFTIRSKLTFCLHKFFMENNFTYINSPIITTADCEGAGECFLLKTQDNSEMFNKKAVLSVSGQLNAEALALSFKNVYTFAPIFRAEKSNTTRHLSEFWMLEPEMSFASLEDAIDISHSMLKYACKFLLDNCKEELLFLSDFNKIDLIKRLDTISNSKYEIISYNQAVDILNDHIKQKKVKFKNSNIKFGIDFNIEHEKYITDVIYKRPVFIINYPKSFKSFYMKLNDDVTVKSFDMLVPGVGELIGGSERETDINIIIERAKDFNINLESIEWYINLRKYGYYKSAGFGLGFERLVMYVTGISNIRDSILFPRAYGKIDF